MIHFAIASALLGAVLGRFFTVWVLVPACAIMFATILAGSLFHEHALLYGFLKFAAGATCLQAGYAFNLLSCVIPAMWQRFRKTGQASRVASQMAATRHR